MRQSVTSCGYCDVQLCIAGTKPHFLVHRLVAQAFLRPPYRWEEVNHRNGDKADNRAANLDWVTASGNQRHRARILKKAVCSEHYRARLSQENVDEIRQRVASGEEQKSMAALFGVSPQQINRIVHRRSWLVRL